MKRTKNLVRKKRGIKPREKLLIACESKETEPNYFNNAKEIWKLSSVFVVKVKYSQKAKGDPRKLIAEAKKWQDEAKEEGMPYDQVWCVFDDDGRTSAKTACEKAEKFQFKIAFSNPAFELWLLMHFQDQNASLDQNEALKKLKKKMPGFEKNAADLFVQLETNLDSAIQRAQVLRKQHRQDQNDETSNPSTSVDQLMGELQKMVRPKISCKRS